MLRWGLGLAVMAGLTVFVALLFWHGLPEIIHGVSMIGWGLTGIVQLRVLAVALAGLAWGLIFGRLVQVSPWIFIGIRMIREAVNVMLPAAQVGGDILGGRLLAQQGVPVALAGASILIDLLLQAVTQGGFAMVGLVTLWWVCGDGPIVRDLGLGFILAIPALGGFFLAQRLGLFMLVDRGLAGLRRYWPEMAPAEPLDLQAGLKRLYADRRALSVASLVHLCAWALGTGEVYLALSGMGETPSLAESVILESLGQAVRSAGFAVPGALGIQEGGFILLGSLFGLSPQTALALSLVKRLPDLVIGLPGLLGWQAMEVSRLRRQIQG